MADDREWTLAELSLSPEERDLLDPPRATCGRCGRKTWDPEQVGDEDRMTQPDGFPCGGRFTAPSEAS